MSLQASEGQYSSDGILAMDAATYALAKARAGWYNRWYWCRRASDIVEDESDKASDEE